MSVCERCFAPFNSAFFGESSIWNLYFRPHRLAPIAVRRGFTWTDGVFPFQLCSQGLLVFDSSAQTPEATAAAVLGRNFKSDKITAGLVS